MGYLQQLLLLPYAYVWLPGLIFLAVAGGLYWVLRPAWLVGPAAPDPSLASADGSIPLTTAQPMKPKPAEKRQSGRRQGNPIEIKLSDPEDKNVSSLTRAYILDRSLGGVRLSTFQKFGVGTILSIRPVNADEVVPWTDVEIRSCRPSAEAPGEFDHGCQFVRTPPYSILLLFG